MAIVARPNVTSSEIKKLLGIILYMGIHKLANRRMYLGHKPRVLLVGETMSRNRFEEVLSIVHFNGNEHCSKDRNDLNYDRVYKLRPFLDHLRTTFKSTAEPETNQSMDEMMIRFNGKHSAKVYMPKKPVEGLQNVVSCWCVWNVSLKSRDILAVATLQKKRARGCPIPSKSEMKKKGRGTMKQFVDEGNGVVITAWFDNRQVLMISNFVGIAPEDQAGRWDKNNNVMLSVERPSSVAVYNTSMGGVDNADMLLALYRSKLKTQKWYQRIAFH